MRRHHSHLARRIEKHEAAQARTLAGDAAEALAIVREVARALTLTPEQEQAMTVMQGLTSGYYELKLKVADRLLKNAELIHGTKSKVETTARPVPVSKAEELAELASLEKDVADRRAELKGAMQ